MSEEAKGLAAMFKQCATDAAGAVDDRYDGLVDAASRGIDNVGKAYDFATEVPGGLSALRVGAMRDLSGVMSDTAGAATELGT